MNEIVTSATAAGIEAAKAILRSPLDWPSPGTGFAYHVFAETGTTKPDFMGQPLKATTAALLRRTPELAAFGYVMDIADEATSALWIEAVEHLRGRDIYPADRQSFIFNPVEILGVAVGLAACRLPADAHRKWFANTIVRGLSAGQFRTPLSTLAARTALACTEESKAATFPPANAFDSRIMLFRSRGAVHQRNLCSNSRATSRQLPIQPKVFRLY